MKKSRFVRPGTKAGLSDATTGKTQNKVALPAYSLLIRGARRFSSCPFLGRLFCQQNP
jgi:hypothetical protein